MIDVEMRTMLLLLLQLLRYTQLNLLTKAVIKNVPGQNFQFNGIE